MFLVRRRIRRVVVNLGVIFGMNLVVCLNVILWLGRVCLWLLMCLCAPPPRWVRCVQVFRRILIGNLLNRSHFSFSEKAVDREWRIKKM